MKLLNESSISKLVAVIGLGFSIGCGGGGGGAEAPAQVSTPPPVLSNGGSGDIIAPGGFNFSTARPVTFEIQADAFAGKRAYVSVYSQYQTSHQGDQLPIYDSKLTMLTLDNAVASEKIMVTNDIQQVFVRVNGVSSGDVPLHAVVNIENGLVNWQF
ncbi:MAG: hypothetical protein OQJ89_08050 [Kangiellaceae bacterium]|nr:hypothetical protein [Kangiellaceae bacterium]MCW8997319.1 hypothetical protein [Kangiellaceae bacterium]MCW9016899.1 hypothetical protein [Kangiellaceae bacterium]